MDWNIVYLESVDDWINRLTKQQLKCVAKELRLLELCGHKLRLPQSKSLGAGLFELRERKFGYRIYYTFNKGMIIVLLQAGDKSSQKRDIELARKALVAYRSAENEG